MSENVLRTQSNTELESSKIRYSRSLKTAAAFCLTAALFGCSPKSTEQSPQTSAIQSSPVASGQNKLPTSIIAETSPAGATSYDARFFYVGGAQTARSKGASVILSQEQPYLAPNDGHSLMELAVESTDGKQIVEVGWTIDDDISKAKKPHLFVFHWVDGKPTCYDACGFVQTSETMFPGDTVQPNTEASYEIEHADDGWEVLYNDAEVGYFPDALWSDRYKDAGLVQAFGEIAANETTLPCTDMGSGDYAHDTSAAQIRNFHLIDSAVASSLEPYATDQELYSYANASQTGMRLGGPGAC